MTIKIGHLNYYNGTHQRRLSWIQKSLINIFFTSKCWFIYFFAVVRCILDLFQLTINKPNSWIYFVHDLGFACRKLYKMYFSIVTPLWHWHLVTKTNIKFKWGYAPVALLRQPGVDLHLKMLWDWRPICLKHTATSKFSIPLKCISADWCAMCAHVCV